MLRPGLLALLLLSLAGCAYDPPMIGDHSTTKYRADLHACRTSVDPRVELQDRSTFPQFLISPATTPFRERAGIRICMIQHGYTLRP